MKPLVSRLAQAGRHGDTMVAHINPREAMVLKSLGGAGTRNPKTGLLEFYSDSDPAGLGGDPGVSDPLGSDPLGLDGPAASIDTSEDTQSQMQGFQDFQDAMDQMSQGALDSSLMSPVTGRMSTVFSDLKQGRFNENTAMNAFAATAMGAVPMAGMLGLGVMGLDALGVPRDENPGYPGTPGGPIEGQTSVGPPNTAPPSSTNNPEGLGAPSVGNAQVAATSEEVYGETIAPDINEQEEQQAQMETYANTLNEYHASIGSPVRMAAVMTRNGITLDYV